MKWFSWWILSHRRDLVTLRIERDASKSIGSKTNEQKLLKKKIMNKFTITSKTCLSKEPCSSYKDFTKEGLSLQMTSMFFFYVEFYKSLKKASIFLRLDVSFLHISEVNFISLPWTLTRPMGPRRTKERQCISKLDEVEIMQDIEHNIIKSSIEKTFLCGHT